MRTICNFFEQSVEKYGENPFLLENTTGNYTSLTYNQIREKVHQFGAGLLEMGLKKGDRVALLAEGCNNWLISELGVIYCGAINVPMSIKLNESDEVKFRIQHSGAKFVIVSSRQAKKVLDLKDQLPDVEKIIVFEPYEKSLDEVLFSEVIEGGKRLLNKNAQQFHDIWMNLDENDYVNICYTSGTTADPKGIILSHKNYVANVYQAYTLMDITPDYRTLLILPWDHAFAHTAGLYAFMGKGASIASIELGKSPMETLKNIPKNIKQVKPHLLMSVPALAKNFKKNIEAGIKAKGASAEKLFNIALNLAYSYNKEGFNKGKGLGFIKKPLLNIFDKILFSKIREGFGGHLEFFIGGGALLDIDLQRFFYAIGIPMLQGYGLSEASPIISSNSLKKHKLGSSGYLVEDMELKICDDDGNALSVGEKGEIVIKGDNVMMGYWNNKEATDETIKDGWLYTGDLGHMDKDGFLYVLGRFKSLLISDDGEKFSPEGIEEALVQHSPYIEQVMLYNNQNPYTVSLIVPNVNQIKNYLNEHPSENPLEDIIFLFENEINKFKAGGDLEGMFPHRWIPSSYALLPEAFTEENRLMNSTLKIVRPKVIETYQDRIDFMYTPEGKSADNIKNREFIEGLLG